MEIYALRPTSFHLPIRCDKYSGSAGSSQHGFYVDYVGAVLAEPDLDLLIRFDGNLSFSIERQDSRGVIDHATLANLEPAPGLNG